MFKNKKNKKAKNEQDLAPATSVFESDDYKNIEASKTDIAPTNEINNPASAKKDPNEIFFEKFEKSKKDFIKEKRREKGEAKKMLSARARVLSFESKLRDDTYFKNFWIIAAIVTVLMLAYVCVVEAFLGPHFSDASNTTNWIPAVTIYAGLTKTSIIFSGFVICLIPLPYIFLLSAWFIGVNNVHRSKTFIIALITILAISLLLIIFIIPFSSFIFNQILVFRPLS